MRNTIRSLAVLLAAGALSAHAASAATMLTFQQGADGYSGAVDTFLQNNLGSGAGFASLTVQLGDLQFSTKNALFRFEDIIGPDPGQIPAGSTIVSATFRVTTTAGVDAAGGQVDLHRMLMAWDADDGNLAYGNPPWNATSWVQADGLEAATSSSATFLPAALSTAYDMDVTADVQAWVNGTAAHGWVLLADPGASDDAAFFHSAEATTVSVRPRLSVEFVPEPGAASLAAACGAALLGLAFRSRRAGRA